MSLQLVGAYRNVALDDLPGSLFELLRQLGITCPEFNKIEASQYGTYTAARAQVDQLRSEAQELERRYLAREGQRVGRAKGVHARDPAVREQILKQLLADDVWLLKIRAIIDLCDEALASDGTLVAIGD